MQAQLDPGPGPNLSERIEAAPTQELVAMLMAGAARFVNQAAAAGQQQDTAGQKHLVQRVVAILEQLDAMLNYEEGGEVVENLSRLYEWWFKELLEASDCGDPARLQHVALQMSRMSESWEQRGVA